MIHIFIIFTRRCIARARVENLSLLCRIKFQSRKIENRDLKGKFKELSRPDEDSIIKSFCVAQSEKETLTRSICQYFLQMASPGYIYDIVEVQFTLQTPFHLFALVFCCLLRSVVFSGLAAVIK